MTLHLAWTGRPSGYDSIGDGCLAASLGQAGTGGTAFPNSGSLCWPWVPHSISSQFRDSWGLGALGACGALTQTLAAFSERLHQSWAGRWVRQNLTSEERPGKPGPRQVTPRAAPCAVEGAGL